MVLLRVRERARSCGTAGFRLHVLRTSYFRRHGTFFHLQAFGYIYDLLDWLAWDWRCGVLAELHFFGSGDRRCGAFAELVIVGVAFLIS